MAGAGLDLTGACSKHSSPTCSSTVSPHLPTAGLPSPLRAGRACSSVHQLPVQPAPRLPRRKGLEPACWGLSPGLPAPSTAVRYALRPGMSWQPHWPLPSPLLMQQGLVGHVPPVPPTLELACRRWTRLLRGFQPSGGDAPMSEAAPHLWKSFSPSLLGSLSRAGESGGSCPLLKPPH